MNNIVLLGLVSFFSDISSEMVYPIIPLYLVNAFGAAPSVVGLIEGIAESLAGILKVFGGRIADKTNRKKPLAFAGYSAGLIYKTALVFARSWPGVLVSRVVDRFGKGIRTAPRDVLVAESANRGSLETRLAEFEHAIKVVYASTMSLSALDYRKRRELDNRDEQMALLIQRVSGSYYGSRYMPCAAGVGYSYSPYRVMKDTDPAAGMLRLVMGLGTSAVDRTEGSYPRIVNLDQPEKTSYSSSADKHKFSQGKAEVIDMAERTLKRLPLREIEPDLPRYLQKILLEHDFDAESRLRETGRFRPVTFISCNACETREWLVQVPDGTWRTVPIDVVLQRASRRS